MATCVGNHCRRTEKEPPKIPDLVQEDMETSVRMVRVTTFPLEPPQGSIVALNQRHTSSDGDGCVLDEGRASD